MIFPARRLALVGAVPLLVASGALAADVSIGGFFSQRFEANDNRGGEGEGFGGNPALDSTTDFGLTITAATPRTRMVFAPGLRALLTTDETPTVENVLPRFNGSLAVSGPRSQTTASLSLIPRFVTDEVLDEEGGVVAVDDVRDESAIQLTTSLRLGYAYTLSARDNLSFGVSGNLRDYPGQDTELDQTRSLGLNASWSRQLTPRTSLSLTPSFQQFLGSGDRSSSQSYSLRAGASHRVNSRLSTSAGLGPSFISREDGSDFGVVGDVGANYRGGEFSYSASLSQSVDQDVEGDIAARINARIGLSRAINETSRISMSASTGIDNPAFGDDTENSLRIIVSPQYAVDLTADWRLSMGYRFTARDEEDGLTPSSSVFVAFSRGLSLLP